MKSVVGVNTGLPSLPPSMLIRLICPSSPSFDRLLVSTGQGPSKVRSSSVSAGHGPHVPPTSRASWTKSDEMHRSHKWPSHCTFLKTSSLGRHMMAPYPPSQTEDERNEGDDAHGCIGHITVDLVDCTCPSEPLESCSCAPPLESAAFSNQRRCFWLWENMLRLAVSALLSDSPPLLR